MIGRIWHGWTALEDADAYQDMLNSDVLPGIHRVPGYQGAYVMRREEGDEVEFMTLTIFESMAAVKQFAGEDYTKAVVQGLAQKLLKRSDARSTHYEILLTPSTTGRQEPKEPMEPATPAEARPAKASKAAKTPRDAK